MYHYHLEAGKRVIHVFVFSVIFKNEMPGINGKYR